MDALKDVAERMESVDFDWAVLAISIQREVGGNLAEVLQTAAETMLHRNRLRAEMKALTAEGRISAIVLGAMPFMLFFFLYTSNREYLQPLFEHDRWAHCDGSRCLSPGGGRFLVVEDRQDRDLI